MKLHASAYGNDYYQFRAIVEAYLLIGCSEEMERQTPQAMQLDMMKNMQMMKATSSYPSSIGPSASQVGTSRMTRSSRCYQCGEYGHTVSKCPEKGQLARCFHCGKRGHQIKECRSKLGSETSSIGGKSTTTSSVKGKGKEKGKGKDKGKDKGKGKLMGMIEENDQENTENEFDGEWTGEVFMLGNDTHVFAYNLVAGWSMFTVDCGAEVHACLITLRYFTERRSWKASPFFEELTATKSSGTGLR